MFSRHCQPIRVQGKGLKGQLQGWIQTTKNTYAYCINSSSMCNQISWSYSYNPNFSLLKYILFVINFLNPFFLEHPSITKLLVPNSCSVLIISPFYQYTLV